MDDTQGRRRTQAVPRRVSACPWDIVRAHPQRQEVEHAWSVEGGEWLPVEAASPFGATRRFQKQIERVHHATDMCLRRLTLHRVALASISEVF